jgi:hypothetical protein
MMEHFLNHMTVNQANGTFMVTLQIRPGEPAAANPFFTRMMKASAQKTPFESELFGICMVTNYKATRHENAFAQISVVLTPGTA